MNSNPSRVRRHRRLSDFQALVLALFMYGVARTPEDVSQVLRIPIEDDAILTEAGIQFMHSANYRLLVIK